MRNLGTRFSGKTLLICALGLPNAVHGLQVPRPPLETTIAEPVARPISFKIPLAGVRFHWCFMNRDELLSGKLTLEVRRGDTTNEIVIFEGGAITPGWEASTLGSPCREESFYFMFTSTTRYLTAPGDELEVELIVQEDLEGIGVFQTGILEAGTYRTAGTYFALRDGPDLPEPSVRPSEAEFTDSMIQGGNTQEEIEAALRGRRSALSMQARTPNLFGPVAFLGCWENPWPLKVTYHEGWMPPEGVAFQERILEIEKAAIEREGGPNCSGPT